MKTKNDGVRRAFEPYSQKEINLILSLVPTYENVKNLANSLGRSEEAISFIYQYAYSGKWMKEGVADQEVNRNNVFTKIAKAKQKAGIFIGFEPG